MLQTHPFGGWKARLSRRLCAEDGTRIKHSLLPPLTVCPLSRRRMTEKGPHTYGPQTCSLELELPLKLSDCFLEPTWALAWA